MHYLVAQLDLQRFIGHVGALPRHCLQREMVSGRGTPYTLSMKDRSSTDRLVGSLLLVLLDQGANVVVPGVSESRLVNMPLSRGNATVKHIHRFITCASLISDMILTTAPDDYSSLYKCVQEH